MDVAGLTYKQQSQNHKPQLGFSSIKMNTHWIEKGETRLCLATEEAWLIHTSLCRHKAILSEPSGSTWAQPDLPVIGQISALEQIW